MADTAFSTNVTGVPAVGAAALCVVLTAHESWIPSSRHLLTGVTQVHVRRGERAIQRGDDLIVALPGRWLSSAHGRMRLDGGIWYIEDIGSKNGGSATSRELTGIGS